MLNKATRLTIGAWSLFDILFVCVSVFLYFISDCYTFRIVTIEVQAQMILIVFVKCLYLCAWSVPGKCLFQVQSNVLIVLHIHLNVVPATVFFWQTFAILLSDTRLVPVQTPISLSTGTKLKIVWRANFYSILTRQKDCAFGPRTFCVWYTVFVARSQWTQSPRLRPIFNYI